jgi:ketosteroid isomerase-like protein
MSADNVEFVRRAYEALNNREFSRMDEFLDPDIEIDVSRNVLNPGVHRGFAGFAEMIRATDEIWDRFRNEIHEVIDAGDRVVVHVTNTATGVGSGVEARMDLFHVLTLRNGKIVRLVGGLQTKEEALEVARLSQRA